MSGRVPRRLLGRLGVLASLVWACAPADDATDLGAVTDEVEAVVWRFHAADTARDAGAVIDLLWPEYEMLVDGARLGYAEVAAGSREFMGSVDVFHTEWSDLRIIPLSVSHAISAFTFRDSIITAAGELIRSQGPTTLVWERRGTTWKLRFGDADHYGIAD